MAWVELEPLAALAWSVLCVIALYTVYILLRGIVAWLDAIIPDIHFGGFLGIGSFSVFGWLKDALNGLVTTVHNDFYYWANEADHAWNQWCHTVATFIHQATYSLDWWANETERAFDWTKRHVIPAVVHALIDPWIADYREARRLVLALEHTVAGLPHDVTKVFESRPFRLTTAELDRIAKLAAADVGAIPFPFASPWPRIRDLEHKLDNLYDASKKLVGGFTVAGIIGLIGATIFDQFGLGWLRCQGVGRIGRALCGLGGLIETLFADAIEALVVGDLCQITEAMAYAARQAEPIIIGFVNVENALIGCGGAQLPPELGVKLPGLPKAAGYTLA